MISVGTCAKRTHPVKTRPFSTIRTHRRNAVTEPFAAVFPVVHTPYDFYERI
jgi:hypothetical protein